MGKYFRQIGVLLLLLVAFLTGCGSPAPPDTSTAPPVSTEPSHEAEMDGPADESAKELRGIWISYNELSMQAEGGGTQESFRAKAASMMQNAADFGLNTVIVHVRAFSDAFYPSEIYPWSRYLTGTEGQDPGYDPLRILVDEAHARGLEFHAWFNPYRVSYSNDFSKLSPENPARKWREDGDSANDRNVFVLDNGIYYNPAIDDVQRLILDGVREIVRNYEVDAVHMDDYFYPTTDAAIDAAEYEAYTQAGGRKAQEDWRRENVTNFVSGLYAAVKAIRPEVQVGISPAADIARNRDKLYADVETWCARPGYLDYIMPQVYYGFENATHPFSESIREWERLVVCDEVSLYYGLALYKSGAEDEYAGAQSQAQDTGRYEWIRNDNVISRQISELRTIPRCGGFVLYAYSSAFADNLSKQAKKEVNFIRSML